MLELNKFSHRRRNALTGEWVVVSPQRTMRPWQGQTETSGSARLPSYDPGCYLCPGNKRAGDNFNPDYEGVYVFDNDFPALQREIPYESTAENDLLVAEAERGVSEVICFTPDHSLTLALMSTEQIEPVVEAWAEEYEQLGELEYVNHVQIFENRGEMMGASNPHPHCQIWASESVPNEPAKEIAAQGAYSRAKGKCLLCNYLELEIADGSRIVCENESFVAVVPFWAVYPFETMVLPRRHARSISELEGDQRRGLADILHAVTARYDNLFQTPFPYSMGFHQMLTDGATHDEFHLHGHFYPPLLRSATVRKFLVGFEILGSPQRDITAESAAERLRSLSEKHYLNAA
jgi:UDPglucose--hexose-1-phosphate uridylyltransferase